MDKKEVIFVLLNNFADWEGAYISTCLNMGVKPRRSGVCLSSWADSVGRAPVLQRGQASRQTGKMRAFSYHFTLSSLISLARTRSSFSTIKDWCLPPFFSCISTMSCLSSGMVNFCRVNTVRPLFCPATQVM